jgi:hypothetical protein
MQGFNVLFPMGFDAFGLNAENAAIKDGIHPMKRTFANIERMRTQMRSMGTMFDWEREAISADPEYYKWTEWFFISDEEGLAIAKCLPWIGVRIAIRHWRASKSGVMIVIASAAARLSSKKIWINGFSKRPSMPMNC